MRTTPRLSLAAAVVVALAGLAACSGAGTHQAGSSGAADTAPEPAVGRTVTGKAGGGDAAAVARPAVRTAAVVKTGRISLTGKDLGKVRREVDDLLGTVGGSVDTEDTRNDRQGRVTSSTLVLRVPVDRFESTKDALERLGELQSSTESAEDVTTEVIDTGERVQTLQNSLDRLQRFQRTASDVRDLIRYEDEITQRQSELQSLQAQQSYLANETSLSTITLRLSTPAAAVARPGALDDAGFTAGLKAGWQALVGAVVVVLTVLGAVLPFLLAGVVVGAPAWLAVRALLRRRRASPPVPAG
jgi:Domain of unknown function (DUF4349)